MLFRSKQSEELSKIFEAEFATLAAKAESDAALKSSRGGRKLSRSGTTKSTGSRKQSRTQHASPTHQPAQPPQQQQQQQQQQQPQQQQQQQYGAYGQAAQPLPAGYGQTYYAPQQAYPYGVQPGAYPPPPPNAYPEQYVDPYAVPDYARIQHDSATTQHLQSTIEIMRAEMGAVTDELRRMREEAARNAQMAITAAAQAAQAAHATSATDDLYASSGSVGTARRGRGAPTRRAPDPPKPRGRAPAKAKRGAPKRRGAAAKRKAAAIENDEDDYSGADDDEVYNGAGTTSRKIGRAHV